MQDYEITAWLGDTELTADQRDRFTREVAEIEATYPDPDDQDLRDEAMSTVIQYMLRETTPDEVSRRVTAATLELGRARAAMRAMARALVADGVSESEAARQLSVQRMTIRAALGK